MFEVTKFLYKLIFLKQCTEKNAVFMEIAKIISKNNVLHSYKE